MMRLFEILFASLLFISYYFLSYFGAFFACFSDDLEFYYGKKQMRNRRRKQKGVWRKFLFLDIRAEIVSWHYVMFWIHLISSVVTLIALDILVAGTSEIARTIFIIAGGTALLTSTIILFVRWPLYAGNKVRNRKKYRQKSPHPKE